MTTSRPDDYRKSPSTKERSSRENVYSYIFQLQNEALRALPESGKPRPADNFPLRGKRTPGDEKKLRLVVNSIFDSLRDLEKFLPPEDDGFATRDRLFLTLLFVSSDRLCRLTRQNVLEPEDLLRSGSQ